MTATPSLHPSSLQLSRWLDGGLDEGAAAAVTKHVATCALCQTVTAQSGDAVEAARPDAAKQLVTAGPRIGAKVLSALAQPRGATAHAGELWRLEWDGRVCLALVLDDAEEGFSADVLVAPATTEVEAADQYTLVADEARSPIGVPLAVWVALRTSVPAFTLDRALGQSDLAKYADEMHGYFLEDRRYEPEADGLGAGLAIVSRADERWAERERVAAVISYLSDARERIDEAADRGTIGDLVSDRDKSAADVARALNIDAHDTFELLSGNVEPDDQQASVLARLLDVSAEDIAGYTHAPDPDLRKAWALPEVREEVERVSLRTGRSVQQIRNAGSESVYAMAARETGTDATGVNAWKALIIAWLNDQA